MQRNSRHILTLGTLSVFVLAFTLTPHVAHAGISAIVSDAALWLPGLIAGKLLMPAASLLVYLSGMILNFSVRYSVLDMKANYDAAQVSVIWSTMRDIANMGFIFVLLYTSILTIFGQGKWQETIKKVVIAALLINFSLFLTEAVIDASNVIALFFYHAISPGVTSANSATTGIATSFMNSLGIQSLYKATGIFSGTKLAIIGIGGTLIYLISSFTFLAVAIMFVIRFAVLLLVVALSPLVLVGTLFPGTSKLQSQWTEALTSQALFAPMYFLMTWVTLKVANSLFSGSTSDIAGALIGKPSSNGTYVIDTGAVGTLVNFLVVIGFLIASLLIAKNMAGKSAGKLNTLAFGAAGAGTFGLAAKVGRGTIGRAGAALASSETVKNAIDRGGAAGAAGRLALLAGNKGAKSSFDGRAAFGLGGVLGAGTPKKGTSFEQDVKNRNRAALDRAKYMKPTDAALNGAKEKERSSRGELETQLLAHGYVKPDALTEAQIKYDVASEAHEKETDPRRKKSLDNEKRAAQVDLKVAEQADAPARSELASLHGGVATAYRAAEEARGVRDRMEERPDRFINKEGEPTVSLPDFAQRILDRRAPRVGAVTEAIGKRGVGGASAPYAKKAADYVSGKANQIREGVRDLPTAARIPLSPLAWLATKPLEKSAQAAAQMVGMRQDERDARIKTIRKELNKKKEETDQEKMLAALEKAAKKDE